jgi:hypothetical protein
MIRDISDSREKHGGAARAMAGRAATASPRGPA